jgi:hypothetical protein
MTIMMIAESVTEFHGVGDPAIVWGGHGIFFMPNEFPAAGLVG